MARKKPKNRSLARESGRPLAGSGFDYGCLPLAAAWSNVTFPALLTNANVVAVGYGESFSQSIGHVIPAISIIGTEAKPLIEAFSLFVAWADATDDEALDVSIVLLPTEGYLLVLGPEPRRLELRCLGYDRTYQQMTFSTHWVKPIDSVNPMLLAIQEYTLGFPAPVEIRAATMPKGANPATLEPDDLSRIDVRPLTTFQLHILSEEDARKPNAPVSAKVAVAMHHRRQKKAGAREKPHRASVTEIAAFRKRSVETHFPVTLERLRSSQLLSATIAGLAYADIQLWQIEQAICNLVLSRELCGTNFFKGIPVEALQEKVRGALASRYEVANGAILPAFDVNDVGAQIMADGVALLRCLGKSASPRNLSGLQRSLLSASALSVEPE